MLVAIKVKVSSFFDMCIKIFLLIYCPAILRFIFFIAQVIAVYAIKPIAICIFKTINSIFYAFFI